MTNAELRLLFLVPFAPRLDADHGGSRAIAGLVTGLAARNHIALLYLRARDEPPIDEAVRERCGVVEEVASVVRQLFHGALAAQDSPSGCVTQRSAGLGDQVAR